MMLTAGDATLKLPNVLVRNLGVEFVLYFVSFYFPAWAVFLSSFSCVVLWSKVFLWAKERRRDRTVARLSKGTLSV